MNVTDVAPVRTDQPGYTLALDALFMLVALFSFIRVSAYAMQQARQGTLVNSPRAPMVFPISSPVGWAFTLSIMLFVFAGSPIFYVMVPASMWVFLTVAQRSAEYQFGLARLGTFNLARFTFVICGAVLFLEVPLSHVIDRLMTWLQMPHPPQPTVIMFNKFQHADQIIYFTLWAVLIVPIIEEMFFRGFLFTFLKRFTNTWAAIILSAGVFAFAHANLGSVLQLWLLGVVLAVAYEHTGSLLLPIGIHGCFNLVTAVSLLIDKGSSS